MGPPTRRLREEEYEERRKDATNAEKTVLEKDETERQLEKILFGDEAGFLAALREPSTSNANALSRIRHDEEHGSDDGVEDEDLVDVPDDELFFLDAGASGLPTDIAQDLQNNDQQAIQHERQSVWVDSDDERLTVSLALNTRLRKLRDTEADDVVTGTEYIQRLRRQYERLHPTPDWVKYARKKRKIHADSRDGSESDSDVSMEDDASLAAAKPLAELLRSSGSLTRSEQASVNGRRTRKLRPEVIDIQRLKDVTGHGPSSIDTLQFHPYFPLLLSAGPSSTINLYHISPQPPNPNPLVTSFHIKGTPLHTAAFCKPQHISETQGNDHTRIFLSSRRRYFHTWSLSTGTVSKISRPLYGSSRQEQRTMESFKLSPCGRYMGLIGSGKSGGGSINVLSTETMQWVCSCRIDSRGGVADFAWWRSGDGFAVAGKNGEVSEYGIDSRRVVARWVDEGAVGTTVITLGGDSGRDGLGGDRWIAVGSSSGVVNVYDRREWTGSTSDKESKTPQRPKPVRAFDQLTTPTSHLEFSHDGQMLVMGSRWKKNAMRLIHLPSCTVYRNWPTDKTPLGRISSVALSVDGAFLAVGNEQGKIRLWQIRD